MTEKELVEMIMRGNVEAFEPLVRPYRQPLLGLARRMVPDAEDAREAAQETLLRAFRHIGRYDTERSLGRARPTKPSRTIRSLPN